MLESPQEEQITPPAVPLTCSWSLPSDLPAEKGRKASGFTNCPFASRKCSG